MSDALYRNIFRHAECRTIAALYNIKRYIVLHKCFYFYLHLKERNSGIIKPLYYSYSQWLVLRRWSGSPDVAQSKPDPSSHSQVPLLRFSVALSDGTSTFGGDWKVEVVMRCCELCLQLTVCSSLRLPPLMSEEGKAQHLSSDGTLIIETQHRFPFLYYNIDSSQTCFDKNPLPATHMTAVTDSLNCSPPVPRHTGQDVSVDFLKLNLEIGSQGERRKYQRALFWNSARVTDCRELTSERKRKLGGEKWMRYERREKVNEENTLLSPENSFHSDPAPMFDGSVAEVIRKFDELQRVASYVWRENNEDRKVDYWSAGTAAVSKKHLGTVKKASPSRKQAVAVIHNNSSSSCSRNIAVVVSCNRRICRP
uniref:Uncharacterized protein n=1 Tax=Setaria digitata TaxID=48799 RepID=A0A915Q7B4_9BILA